MNTEKDNKARGAGKPRPTGVRCCKCGDVVACTHDGVLRKTRFCACGELAVYAYPDAVHVADSVKPFAADIVWSQ